MDMGLIWIVNLITGGDRMSVAKIAGMWYSILWFRYGAQSLKEHQMHEMEDLSVRYWYLLKVVEMVRSAERA